MKKVKEIIGRLTAGSLRLAALFVALGLAGNAWAAAPTATAVWDTDQIKAASEGSIPAVQGDFGTTASGYTITVGD